MSLIAADALITNDMLRRRVEAAVRKVAAQRLAWEGNAGKLAREGYYAPGTVAPSFTLVLATNTEVVSEACPSCGDVSPVPDETIEWVVTNSWADVALERFGPEEEVPSE